MRPDAAGSAALGRTTGMSYLTIAHILLMSVSLYERGDVLKLAATQSDVYRSNIGMLYSYNDEIYKLVHCKHAIRMPGWEEQKPSRKYTPKGCAGNMDKLERNVRRARDTVFELSFCNVWDYFVTLTFASTKLSDRYDLNSIMKRLGKWLSNYNSRYADGEVLYLLIPEKHKDGAWHLHGFLSGIPQYDLHKFSSDQHLPYSILKRVGEGNEVYSWIPYHSKFGFCTMELVRSREGAAKYVTKYITKDLHRSVEKINAHMYYCSKGLKRKQLLYRDEVAQDFIPDFENDYVRIKQSKQLDELAQVFCDNQKGECYE